MQWRRNEFESGGTIPERKWEKFFGHVPPLFGSKNTISRFGERFRDGQYTVWSVSCLLFLYSRCSPCSAICKSGEHVPFVPHGVDATGYRPNWCKIIILLTQHRQILVYKRTIMVSWKTRNHYSHSSLPICFSAKICRGAISKKKIHRICNSCKSDFLGANIAYACSATIHRSTCLHVDGRWASLHSTSSALHFRPRQSSARTHMLYAVRRRRAADALY